MTKYEELLELARKEGIQVFESYFVSDANGLYANGVIVIRDELSETEKTCVLAEELGHYYTSIGDISNQLTTDNRKQELTARKWAVEKIIKIEMLIIAIKEGCESLFDIAEYLDITIDFLKEAIVAFKRKYGITYRHDNNMIVFNDYGVCVLDVNAVC